MLKKTVDGTCQDTWVASLLWGRIGSAILVIISMILGAYGIQFGDDDQASAYEIVSAILASVGAGMAIVSKMRQAKENAGTCVEK